MTAVHAASPAKLHTRPWQAGARASVIVLITLLQLTVLDRNYDSPLAVMDPAPELWIAVNHALKALALIALFGAVAFALLAFARGGVFAAWREGQDRHRWGRWLAAECALFFMVLAALLTLQNAAAAPPWLALACIVIAGACMLACAAFALAPVRFWRAIAAQSRVDYAIAFGFGACALGAYHLAQDSWWALSAATLHTSYFILQLYEPSASIDVAQRILGAGDFRVSIEAPCSGYEGIGLVLTMLGFYLFAFRRDLRFPHVLALLPIGVVAIWLSNALRIALLISLGAHASPDMALNGFHAQAGWVMFLVVTVTLMLAAHHAPIFRRNAAQAVRHDPAVTLAAALLAPFAALMAARAIASMFGDHGYWPSVLLIALPTLAIWRHRAPILSQIQRIGWEPWGIGLLVGVLWIATEPASADRLGPWLGAQPEGASAAWVALRIFGFALIVPIAEELAFRGYLHRALVKRRFEEAAPAAFSWLALVATSLLFGAMHGRGGAGALAGMAFALTLYRSKTIAAPIAAHIAANGLIAAFAVLTESWTLL